MHSFCKAAFALGFTDLCKDKNVDLSTQFLEHIATHGISYGTQEEYMFRQAIFNAKVAEFAKINADPQNTFTVGTNFMTTWTAEEYKKLLGYRGNATNADEPTILSTEGIPAAKDWRTLGAVNAVKNQAQCGSCWAFSATSAIESAQYIQKGGNLYSLSEQELVSCDTSCYGCQGGLQSYGMNYVSQHGQVTESEYPYTSGSGNSGSCQQRGSPVAYVSQVNYVQAKSAAQLLAAISQGPVSVTVDANNMAFQGYTGGIVNSAACGTQLDHAITAVGFGNKNGQSYYIVRNSWGPWWGDQGYIMIAAVEGTVGICGIQQSSVWPNMQ